MTIKSKNNIKVIMKFILLIVLILSIPNAVQVIWNCGKDFGNNIAKFIMSLIS